MSEARLLKDAAGVRLCEAVPASSSSVAVGFRDTKMGLKGQKQTKSMLTASRFGFCRTYEAARREAKACAVQLYLDRGYILLDDIVPVARLATAPAKACFQTSPLAEKPCELCLQSFRRTHERIGQRGRIHRARRRPEIVFCVVFNPYLAIAQFAPSEAYVLAAAVGKPGL